MPRKPLTAVRFFPSNRWTVFTKKAGEQRGGRYKVPLMFYVRDLKFGRKK